MPTVYRYTGTYKATGLPSGISAPPSPSVFIYSDTDENANAFFQALENYQNAKLVSVTKQVLSDDTYGAGPYPDAAANGGSSRERVSMRSTPDAGHPRGVLYQFNIPFLRDDISKEVVEATIEGATGIYNEQAIAIGQVVKIEEVARIDGTRADPQQPELPAAGG